MTKKLSVSAINTGTVIDHVRAGQALKIVKFLRILHDSQNKVTLGLNLSSNLVGFKDIIKIENYRLTEDEANQIAAFSPEATINIIDDFEVTHKNKIALPNIVEDVFICKNPACITHNEPMKSKFHLTEQGKKIHLTCYYCEKSFDKDQLKINS